mmetsp:Transcript_41794/g.115217  ORF Transcript_41794/g.115217 Transcript_41794/m.115217 type:complete len:258 (+) Transcript_41794:793-1566(+)
MLRSPRGLCRTSSSSSKTICAPRAHARPRSARALLPLATSSHRLLPTAHLVATTTCYCVLLSSYATTCYFTVTTQDQNIHDAILVSLVDSAILGDRMVNAVAELLGVRWHAVKQAVLHRMKIDDEESERVVGVWQQRVRSMRCDAYVLPGLYAFCHDENFFRFASRFSEPLREHVDVGEYKIHWAREVPNLLKDVVDMYLNEDGAQKYRDVCIATVRQQIATRRPPSTSRRTTATSPRGRPMCRPHLHASARQPVRL